MIVADALLFLAAGLLALWLLRPSLPALGLRHAALVSTRPDEALGRA
jgi:hypothetical protein